MKIKKIITALLVLLITIAPVKIDAKEKTNRFDNWKETAIIAPDTGQLKASGEIEVIFNQFDNEDIVIDHYDLYLDGNKVNSVKASDEAIIKTTIYLTKTDYYLLQVVAVSNLNHEFSSNVRKFRVAKKGLNIDDQTVKTTVDEMEESWYYNWSSRPSSKVSGDKEFVPMIWGKDNLSWLESDSINDYSSVLGFNEPDLSNQANMSALEAASYQEMFTNTNLRIGSCAVSYPLNEWFSEYASNIDMTNIDFIPVHIYYDWGGDGMAEAFLEAIDTLYQTYHKPIWITEFGLSNSGLYGANSSYEDADKQIAAYMEEVIAGLESRDYVERYTWFNFNENDLNGGKTALYSQETGKLTPLGELYKSLGNPDIEGIDLNDEYVEDSGYYVDLDRVIEQADSLINSNEYSNYLNVADFENVLNEAKSIDRNLGSSRQYLIDDLTSRLKDALTNLEKVSVSEVKDKQSLPKDTSLPKTSNSVATGDKNDLIVFTGLMVLSLGGLILMKKDLF